MRIALGIEYDGTAYNGWQRQRTGDGVQAHVEKALSKVADEAIEVVCAGRTDTGVHATGQVVHFETNSERSERSWLLGANTNMPNDIAVTWAQPVAEDFHARFSALTRSYRYVILNCLVRSALNRHRAWWVYQPLDADRMHTAAQTLVGKHDFSAFRAAGCQASTPTREILSISVVRDSDKIYIDVTANAFLQHMVRNIAGTLVAIGTGEETIDSMAEILQSRDRKRGGGSPPPHGLTLVNVEYPDDFQLPKKVNMPT
ncbi:MAG: tRNA pseudouridine(38-40) synthase TruA [Woeseiaceae bacterium]